MATFTAGEIAERIREPGESLKTVVNRLNNYTLVGLLKPVGKRTPGSGNKRRYPERALIEAALLNKLTTIFSIPASHVRLFGRALDLAVEGAARVLEERQQGRSIYLAIRIVDDSDIAWGFEAPSGVFKSMMTEIVSVPDQAGAVSDADESRLLWRLVNAELGIFINLTQLVERIQPFGAIDG